MRGLRWSGKRRGDVAGAAQILCAAELCGRAARVWRRRLRGGDGSPGGCGLGRLKRAPDFWACVPRERRSEIPGGDLGVQLHGGGEEDDPDVWVRPGSEGGTGRGRATRALTPRPRWQGVGARESGRWQVDLRVGR